ncbi:MAG: 5'-nucleotidase [Lysobacterales bacterium]|jgi:5'-nucleotidase|nr:MAG: 5'-nucleotidase [Xanthomonadales bacterium]
MSDSPEQKGLASDGEKGRLVVAISSRALFDLEEAHRIFEQQGLEAYARYQIERENEILGPGIAFPLVRKLLALNQALPPAGPKVEVILLSRNSSDTGLRVFNSIEHYGLEISRAVFTGGAPLSRYVRPFGADLFLSADPEDVRRALQEGVAAATILGGPGSPAEYTQTQELRIAFDGDAVIFGDEAERVTAEAGFDAFRLSEQAQAERPLSAGPFKGFLQALHLLQQALPSEHPPIRTALVTARSAPAHKRVILTLRHWGVRIDEALFLGGLDKGPFLAAFGADIFFDDQRGYVERAARHVPAGHVPHGVRNPS